MKHSKKLLSVLLAVLLLLSTVSVGFAGTLGITKADKDGANGTTLETLISNENLSKLLGNLISDLNGAKTNATGTVLRLVFMFVDEDSLQAQIKAAGITDLSAAKDTELAVVLLDWLNANLPDWTKDITSESWYTTVQSIAGVLSIELDLKTVNGVLATVRSVCDKLSNDIVFTAIDGDLEDLNGNALNVSYTKGNGTSALNVIYGLFQWLNDNKGIVQKVVKGGIGVSGGLSLGSIFDGILGDTLNDVNKIIKNIPDFAKSYIFQLVNGYAEEGDIKKNPKGGWGESLLKDFTADELLAAALLKVVGGFTSGSDSYTKFSAAYGDDASKIKKAADDALKLNFYELLSSNIEPLFKSLDAANWLTEKSKSLIEDYLCATPEITAKFKDKASIVFTNDTFKTVYESAKTNGVLGSFNELLCVILKTVLTDATYKELNLASGGNDKLNANLTELCRYILPLMANDTVKTKLGYDFSQFTKEAVKTMELKDMGVAVLKLFFNDWFGKNPLFSTTAVDNAKTIPQLIALANYYTVTNEEWLHDYTYTAAVAPKANLKDAEATEYMLNTTLRFGLHCLNNEEVKNTVYFSSALNEKTATYYEILDDVSDWAINFAYGIPAVTTTFTTKERNKYDPFAVTPKSGYTANDIYGAFANNGAYYKINVLLNELIDFAFFTKDNNAHKTSFDFDLGLFFTDTVLDNVYNFDLAGLLGALKINNREDNLFNQKNVVNAVLQFLDKAVTAFFKTSTGTTAEQTVQKTFVKKTESVCSETLKITCTYYTANGRFTKTPETAVSQDKTHNYKVTDETHKKGANCKTKGYVVKVCQDCGYSYNDSNAGTYGDHTLVQVKAKAATCTATGNKAHYKCSACGKLYADAKAKTGITTKDVTIAKVAHNYVNGVCTVCKAKDPSYVAYTLGDIDGDGVSASDARLALRASVGLENFAKGSNQFLAADVNKDGGIGADDARLILRAAVGLEILK